MHCEESTWGSFFIFCPPSISKNSSAQQIVDDDADIGADCNRCLNIVNVNMI